MEKARRLFNISSAALIVTTLSTAGSRPMQAPALPDLGIRDASACLTSSTYVVWKKSHYSFYIVNEGSIEAGPTTTRLKFQPSDGSTPLVDDIEEAALGPGESRRVIFDQTEGPYDAGVVFIKVDALNQVDESDESNNEAEFPISICINNTFLPISYRNFGH